MDAKQLGNKIQELRKEKGMTQEDLAEKTGLSVRTIQRIESGEVDPRTYTLHQIADALGIDITELTKDPGEEDDQPGKKDERKWLTLLHLSGFLVLLFPPLIIWILKRDTYPAMDPHGKAVMNFQISMWIYLFAGSFTIFLAIGIFLMPLLGIFSTFVVIINTVRVAGGNSYYYPLSIRFLK
jgi:uncharacterized Tic20 family protein/DNA-binding XRE family transcriptional regulator